jgi:hypothetical protein
MQEGKYKIKVSFIKPSQIKFNFLSTDMDLVTEVKQEAIGQRVYLDTVDSPGNPKDMKINLDLEEVLDLTNP